MSDRCPLGYLSLLPYKCTGNVLVAQGLVTPNCLIISGPKSYLLKILCLSWLPVSLTYMIILSCKCSPDTRYIFITYTRQKSSAHFRFQVNFVLTRNSCIKYYISLFKEIILQQFDKFQTEIQGSLTKLSAFNPSKMAKFQIMAPGAENMEYLNNP